MIDLRKSIKNRGWTISAIASKLGISQSSLSIQLSNNTMPLTRLQEVAKIIGISPSRLIADEEDTPQFKCPHCGKPINIVVDKEKTTNQ